MSKKNDLTNEKLRNLYSNPFELVSSAINIAHQVIESGKELKEGPNKNMAAQVLKKILKDHETEKQSEEMMDLEKGQAHANDKDLPDPLLQAV